MSKYEWLCPKCGEQVNLVKATIVDTKRGKTSVKFKCGSCGYVEVKEEYDAERN
jgi:predicted RNA-binding Zn-ribbon protein involved in translation (DUF1610 family)